MPCWCQYTLYNHFHFRRVAAKSCGQREHSCSTKSLTQIPLIIECSAKFWIKLRKTESALSYPHIQGFHRQLTSLFQSPQFLRVQSHWSWCSSLHPCYNTEGSPAAPHQRKKTKSNTFKIFLFPKNFILSHLVQEAMPVISSQRQYCMSETLQYVWMDHVQILRHTVVVTVCCCCYQKAIAT